MRAQDRTRIEVRDLAVIFPPRNEGDEPFVAVEGTHFSVAEGEFCSIVGPSGCGKSTALNVIAGLIPPARGEVFVDGARVTGVNRKIGYMFQKDTLLPWASALGNVMLPLEVNGTKDRKRARDLLRLVGLAGFEHHYPRELSGGMRKRVQLARVLAQDPEILLMDEPFGALDAQTKLIIQEEFLRIWEHNRKTVVFITHDLQEAITLSDRILIMTARPGRIRNSYSVPLARPRDIATVINDPRFNVLFNEMWSVLRQEVQTLDIHAG